MRLAIFEPKATGHHMASYVHHIARCALDRGWVVDLVTTTSASQTSAYTMAVNFGNSRFQSHIVGEAWTGSVKGISADVLRQATNYLWMHRAYRRLVESTNRPDVAYVVNLDHCDKFLAIFGTPFASTPFAGTLMSPKFHLNESGVVGPIGRMQKIHASSFRRLLLLPTLCRLVTIDETLPDYLRSRDLPGNEKVRLVPDIANFVGDLSKDECRRHLGIADEEIVIAVYGALSSRKGISHLLNAVSDEFCDRRVSVLLAGQMEPSVRALQRSTVGLELARGGRLRWYEGFLSSEEEYRVIRAADIVWLGYDEFFGMSGVLVQAGMAAAPIIACNQGLIGYLATKYAMGVVVDPTNSRQTVDAINYLGSDASLRTALGQNGYDYARDHTPQRFASAVCDAIASSVADVQGSATRTGAEALH